MKKIRDVTQDSHAARHDRMSELVDAARECDKGLRFLQNGSAILFSRLPAQRARIRDELRYRADNALAGLATQPLGSFVGLLLKRLGSAPLNPEAPPMPVRKSPVSLLDTVTP